jgi:hypothetical protein
VPDRDAPICGMLWPTDLRSEDETFDNARLIAAAPELLEALLTFEKQWNACGPNSDFGRHFQSVRDVAVEALAKAKADHWLNTSRAAIAKARP